MKHIIRSNSSLHPYPSAEAIQPNAVDLCLEKVFEYEKNSPFRISESSKMHRVGHEMQPDESGWYHLEEGAYEVQFSQTVKIGPGEAGWVITRSTLNRNGLFLTSGLYDSGYHGAMAGCLHIQGGPAVIAKGTRIGQFLLFDAESLSQYSGSYGFGADGTVKPDEQKYHAEGSK